MVWRPMQLRSGILSQLMLGFWIIAALAAGLYFLTRRDVPDTIDYGMTFTKLQADELGLDWRAVYIAALDDLGIRKFRLAAHWPMVEPQRDSYNFDALDFQIEEASKRDAEVILAVGRRLPRWPECHVPRWVADMPWEEEKQEIREYISAVVDRYKDDPTIVMWQVENEPFLAFFAYEHCGDLDAEFLVDEVALVKALDPSRPVLVTDSGNLGTWYQPYRLGDAFGTSLYMYFWNPELGQFKTRLPAAFYRVKANVMKVFGVKPVILIELSAEPWLTEPTVSTPIATQLTRMDVEKFDEIIEYASRTHFSEQYLWGVEWWYWMRLNGHPEFWERAKDLY